MITLHSPRRPRNLRGMEPRPEQPFGCPVKGCNLNFSTGKALDNHLKDKHEPVFTAEDRMFLKSLKIKVEE